MTETDHVLRRKPLVFVASSRKDLQRMPEDVQDSFGFKFDRAQIGRHPAGARPFGEGLRAAILKLTADEDKAAPLRRPAPPERSRTLARLTVVDTML